MCKLAFGPGKIHHIQFLLLNATAIRGVHHKGDTRAYAIPHATRLALLLAVSIEPWGAQWLIGRAARQTPSGGGARVRRVVSRLVEQ